MTTEELYKGMALINKKPSSERYVQSLYNLLKSEDRFFSQDEVKQFLVIPFETHLMLRHHHFFYIDYVYGAPIYYFQISNNQFSQLIFCSKDYFLELASDILIEIFNSRNRKNLTVGVLERQLRHDLQVYLGLGDREFKQFPPEIITTIVDAFPEKFVLQSKSAIDNKMDLVVSIEVSASDSMNPVRFLNHLIRLSRKHSTEDTKQLLLKLNLSSEDYGMTKPYSSHTIEKISAAFPETLKFDGSQINILPISERITSSLNNKSSIDNFPLQAGNLSGLLVFSFVGNEFPVKEAKTYVSLRSQIIFMAVSDLKQVYGKIFTQESYELTKILKAFLGDIDVWEWAKENLAVSFLVEDYDYLKLNFDSLMQEYSPVFNLDRNPGNLFRGIIEEKIREYESGREQGTEN